MLVNQQSQMKHTLSKRSGLTNMTALFNGETFQWYVARGYSYVMVVDMETRITVNGEAINDN